MGDIDLIVARRSLRELINHPPKFQNTKMISRTALHAAKAPSTIATRGFRTSTARLSSPYHYPEGPRSNIPFNPLTKYFAVRYWGTMAFFFGLPFGIAVWQTKKNH